MAQDNRVRCPGYDRNDDVHKRVATGNELRSLGWNGDTNEVECKRCGHRFDVDHSGDTPEVDTGTSGSDTSGSSDGGGEE